MAHVQRVQKKTSTMSLTISSCSSTASSSRDHFSCSPSSSSSSSSNLLTQKHSSLVQPLCVSPQRTQSPVYTQPAGGGVAPTFVKCLHDVTTLKGQLVVLECRLRGPPPLQVMWYREEEKILDSDDFRILRKKASSAPVPEELCTLVITEAFPEDSGLFKCVAINPFGTVSCCAALEVYHDMEEQLEMEAVHQQKMVSAQEDVEDMFHPGTCGRQSCEDSPPPFSDSMNPDPPDWPDVCMDDDVTAAVFPSPQLSTRCSEGPQVQTSASSPSPPPPSPPPSPPPPPPPPPAKLFTPSKITFTSGGDNMNLSDLPTFTPTNFPPSAFNYERPRHFIQSQPSFQAPSYDSVVRDAQEYQNADPPGQGQGRSTPGHSASRSQSVSKSSSRFESMNQIQSQFTAQTGHQNQTNGLVKSSPSSGLSSPVPSSSSSTSALFTPVVCTSSSSAPRTTVRSTITLTPNVPSATGLGSATLPANQDGMSVPAAYLCSVLPSQNAFPFSSSKLSPNSSLPPPSVSPPRSPLSPSSSSSSSFQQLNSQNRVQPAVVSLPAHYKGSPNTLPKPILKKSVAPRPSSSRSTDEDIQGSKDALIQDLEKKLRTKEARRRSTQKLSYEERMARRLLGPDNVSTVFDQDRLSDSQLDQPDSPEGKHTGGLWGRHHSGTDERGNEGSAIQEKCYAPRFLQIPPDLTVEEGRFCRVDFKVGGLPTPDVCWYLDGKAIRPDDYHKMLVCEKGLHSFIIEIVTVHHAGVYECVAKNRAGESRFSMRLDVIAQELLRPPTFVQKMSNSRALEGDTVRLECKVDASPPPQLFWKKDKDMMRLDPTRMSLYQDGSGRQCLLIERVLKSDAGWYTLSAINEAGMSTCNARLDVSARAGTALKTAPPGSKTLKLLSSLSHVPGPSSESAPQHTAPLYESAEL